MASAIFASARVKAKEAKLLGADRLHRMTEALSPADVLKIIYESSYVEGIMINDPKEYGRILDAELNALLAFFNEACPDINVARVYLMEYDYRNAKALAKAKYSKGREYRHMMYENTLLPYKQLEENIFGDNYTLLPKPMAEALKEIDVNYASYGVNPAVWDSILNKALYEDMIYTAKLCKDAEIEKYVSLRADTENFLTALKCRFADIPLHEIEKQLVNGGSISKKVFEGVLSAPLDGISEMLRHTVLSELAQSALKDIENEGIVILEREAENMLNSYFKDKRNIMESLYPLLNYFLTKLAEIKNVNIIFTGIWGGASPADIKKRQRAI